MKTTEMKNGMTVQLKSGGPVMTITDDRPSPRGSIECRWFDGQVLKAGYFDPSTLEAVNDPPDSPKSVL